MMKKLILALLALAFAGVQPAAAAIVGPYPYNLTNGTTADANQVMANFNKIMNDVNNNVIFPSFSQQNYYAADAGAANAIVVTLSPVPTSYTAGMVVNVKIAANNSGATTINANALGVQNVVNVDGSSLKSRQLLTGMLAQMVYTGSNFQLLTLSPLGVRQSALGRTTQLFTTPGLWTFTVPAGVYSIRLQAWGGGGGGGGASGAPYAGGGASGSYGLAYLAVVPGDTLGGSIGAGGPAGLNTPTAGTTGGTTTYILNGVLQGSAIGGPGGATGASGVGGTGPNVTGTWNFSASGQNGGQGNVFGQGGSAPSGGVGGLNPGTGCANGGGPGGGGSGGSTSAGCPGGNGWVYIEY